jgi:hypothetical protein
MKKRQQISEIFILFHGIFTVNVVFDGKKFNRFNGNGSATSPKRGHL